MNLFSEFYNQLLSHEIIKKVEDDDLWENYDEKHSNDGISSSYFQPIKSWSQFIYKTDFIIHQIRKKLYPTLNKSDLSLS